MIGRMMSLSNWGLSLRISNCSIWALALSVLIILNGAGSMACVPDFPFYVIYNDVRPNLPLARFAAGELGILQGSYAKSYLAVAYRYLSHLPLAPCEQQNILRLWRMRLGDQSGVLYSRFIDETMAYRQSRDKIMGTTVVCGSTERVSNYCYTEHLLFDAMKRARSRQLDLIKRYGLKSAAVREWQAAQDVVFFSAGDGKKRSIAARPERCVKTLAGRFEPDFLQDCRDYQTASLAFYCGDYAAAGSKFKNIAADKQSPYCLLASYMVARNMANAVLKGEASVDRDEAIAYIEKLLREHHDSSFRQDLFDLLTPLNYQYLDRGGIIAAAAAGVMQVGNERFGSDVGDLTYSMDEMTEDLAPDKIASLDLTDWLRTMQFASIDLRYANADSQQKARQDYEMQAAHALAMYRAKKTLPWLVAAVSLNGLRDRAGLDILDAARSVPESSPAYLTVNYYIVDADIAAGKHKQAREKLLRLLQLKNIPAGSRNLLKAQMLAVAENVDAYLGVSPMAAERRQGWLLEPEPEVSSAGGDTGGGNSAEYCLGNEIADDLNIHMPLDLWLKFSERRDLPDDLRSRLVRTTWLRAHLLGRRDIYSRLTVTMCRYFPSLAAAVRLCDSVPEKKSKYVLAQICLRNFGMSPYFCGELERHGLGLNEFDYYNQNFWQPMADQPAPKKNDQVDQSTYSDYADELVYSANADFCDRDQSQMLLDRISAASAQYTAMGISRFLTAAQKKQALAEARTLSALPPAKVFGDAVFAEWRANPNDPAMAEMLYRLVKLAKWSARTHTASEYSHRAHNLLKAHYSSTKWARQAPFWY